MPRTRKRKIKDEEHVVKEKRAAAATKCRSSVNFDGSKKRKSYSDGGSSSDSSESNTISRYSRRPRKEKQLKKNSIKPEKTMRAKVVLTPLKVKSECDVLCAEQILCNSNKILNSENTLNNVKGEANCIYECSVQTEVPECSKALTVNKAEDSSSSDSEWEEVEEQPEQSLDDYKPEIPQEGVEITIDCPEIAMRRRKKKQFDEREYIRLYINRMKKEAQLNVHKTHLLCLLAHGLYLNNILNSPLLKGMALSYIPSHIADCSVGRKVDKIDSDGIKNIVSWFRDTFSFGSEENLFLNIFENMVKSFKIQKSRNASEYNLMLVVVARSLGFKSRLCISLYPLTYKAQNLIRKPGNKRISKKEVSNIDKEGKESDAAASTLHSSDAKCKKAKQIKKSKNLEPKQKAEKEKMSKKLNEGNVNRPRRSKGKNYKISSDECDDDSDDDFVISDVRNSDDDDDHKEKKHHSSKTVSHKPLVKEKNRKVLSSDSGSSSPEPPSFANDKILCWAEIFSVPDKQWICIECVNDIVNNPYGIEKHAPQPVTYILAYDNNSYVKDVTRRYCDDFMTSTRKLRVDSEWWEETLEPFLPPNSKLDKEEENKLNLMLTKKPLPHTVAGFKNHPLYALKRHLLKFEAIYPPDAAPVGFIRGEPVYPRDCVCQLHSRETWLKEARVVRIGEEPYKIVKARPKWDKMAGVVRTDLPLEIFGYWQTEQYQPPVAKDGKVPRNEYGNVELFKPCMLPKGTVHLQIPGLNRVARKLGIDCSPAVIGFDGHKGSVHPVFDGFIICKEYKETILAAWEEEQENARRREEEKREKRIYGNWKKLIKGLLIRERIKLKYDV